MPAAIIAAREEAGLTQTAAADLIYSGLRTWQQWEAGDRRMHPALWDLFRIRVRAADVEDAFAAWWGDGGDDMDAGIARDAWSAACAWVMTSLPSKP